jgi:DNA-binding transcriptional regulator YhcF (GntR family)
MKTYNDINILNLIEQIREVNHLIELHKLSNDDFMLNQYKARKNDLLKELVFELICLDINTNEIYKLVRNLIDKIENNTPKVETQSIYQNIHFSIHELESVTN